MTRKDDNSCEIDVGLTGNDIKTRYRSHTSFRTQTKINSTELSTHIWELKDKEINYEISWRILSRANTYDSATKRCNFNMPTRKVYYLSTEKMYTEQMK